MAAYQVTKAWSAAKGTRWELTSTDKNYPAKFTPFATAYDAYKFALDHDLPVYEDWD